MQYCWIVQYIEQHNNIAILLILCLSLIQLKKGPHSGPPSTSVQKYVPLVIGSAAAISASDSATKQDTVLTRIQEDTAACGPLVVITNPKRMGMPDTKFMHCKNASLD